MSDLKLEVGLKISDQEADQSIRTLQDKLKRLQQATGTEMSPQAQQQQAGQSRALQDMQKRYVGDLNNRYQQIQKTMTDIDKLYQNQMLGDKSRVAMQEKLLELKRQEKQIGETMKTAGVTPPGQVPPGQQPPSPEERTGLDLLKTLGKIVASGAIAKGALNFAQGMVTLPGQTLMAEGAIRQAQMMPLQMGMQGRGYELAAFGQERGKAFGMAQDQMENQKMMDRIGTAVGLTLSTISGALVGKGIGAVAGAASYAGSNQRGMLSLGSMFGIGEDAYDAIIQKEGIQNFEAYTQALRYQDPSKGLGSDFLNKNLGGVVGVERATGLSDEMLHGRMARPGKWGSGYDFQTGRDDSQEFVTDQERTQGLIGKSALYGSTDGRARFETSRVMETITKLMQAGVSQGQIAEGETGAGQVLGLEQKGVRGAVGITGKLGQVGAMQSDEALIRLFAEGTKKGVEKIGEDLNKFMTVTVDLATKTGEFSGEIVARVANSLVDDTDFALKAAASMSQKITEKDETLEGLEGQAGMQAATSLKTYTDLFGEEKGEEVLKNIMKDPFLAQELVQLTIEQIKADPKLAESLGARLGVDAGGAIGAVGAIGKRKVGARVGMHPEFEEIQARRGTEEEQLGDYSKSVGIVRNFEGIKTAKEAMTFLNQIRNFGQEQEADTSIDPLAGTLIGQPGRQKGARELFEGFTGGVGESALRSKAIADQAGYEGFQEHREQFQKSAEAYSVGLATFEQTMSGFNDAVGKSTSGLAGLGNVLKEILTVYNKHATSDMVKIDMSPFEPRTSVYPTGVRSAKDM